jgi:hypothetical protein
MRSVTQRWESIVNCILIAEDLQTRSGKSLGATPAYMLANEEDVRRLHQIG